MNTLALRIPTALLGLIAIGTGASSVLGGLTDAAPLVDNTFRFYAGIWFAIGLGLIHAAVVWEANARVFALAMRALILGGFARAIGLLDYPPEPGVVVAIGIEVVVPAMLLVLRGRADRKRVASSVKNGKSVLVTGSNGGLGQATSAELLADGVSRLVMAARTDAKAQASRSAVSAAVACGPETEVGVAGGFDMTDPARIRAAVDALPAGRPFDVVFLQAGGVVFAEDFQRVEHDGRAYERTAFQNVLGGHVALSRLVERGLLAPHARVVFAGGEGARGIPGLIARPSFGDPEALRRYLEGDFEGRGPYNPMDAIGVSKLVGALWTRALRRRLPDAEVVWFSPGLTYGTQGLAKAPPLRRIVLERVGFPIMAALGLAQSPAQGGRKYADCLLGTVGRDGDIIGAPEGKALGPLTDQTPMHEAFEDDALAETVWSVAESVSGSFGGQERPIRLRTPA